MPQRARAQKNFFLGSFFNLFPLFIGNRLRFKLPKSPVIWGPPPQSMFAHQRTQDKNRKLFIVNGISGLNFEEKINKNLFQLCRNLENKNNPKQFLNSFEQKHCRILSRSHSTRGKNSFCAYRRSTQMAQRGIIIC